jgi:hypothetical protein
LLKLRVFTQETNKPNRSVIADVAVDSETKKVRNEVEQGKPPAARCSVRED